MLDTYGIIKGTRLTRARRIDAAFNLLYHTHARPIGLCESSQPHSTVVAGFCVVSEGVMLKQCPICNKEFKVKPSHVKWRVFCSYVCKGKHQSQVMSGEQSPCYRAELTRNCKGCGKSFRNYNKVVQYCSRACKPHVMMACHDCGTAIRLNPSRAARLKRSPLCKPCHQRHHEASANGTRLRVQTCDKCRLRFESAHHRRFCPSCSPYQWDGKSPNTTCVACGNLFAKRPGSKRKTCSEECSRRNWAAQHRGARSRFWKGGVSSAETLFRKTLEYRAWRTTVYQRDKRVCQLCKAHARPAVAHHILMFATHPDLRLEVSNGITLCAPCHNRIRQHEDDYIEQFQAIVQSKAEK